MDRGARITKGDIANHLIHCFGLGSYLEYNKFDGQSYFDAVRCADKVLAFAPESSLLDRANLPRLLGMASAISPEQLVSLDELLARHGERRFDLVFYDPVHIRPEVDLALQTLPRLLKPGGFLLVHDCNPEREELTSPQRRHGAWTGETYKAFALFRHFNRRRAITVSEDFGVGVVWNHGLDLRYPLERDCSYADFAARRQEYAGLRSYAEFQAGSRNGRLAQLFDRERAAAQPVIWQPLRPGASQSRFECQLFWRAGGLDFSAACSRSVTLPQHAAACRASFELPDDAAAPAALRFDPSERPMGLRIDGLRVLDAQGVAVWEWDRRADLFAQPVQLRQLRDGAQGHCYLLAEGSDPHAELALPPALLARLGARWRLEFELAPLPDSALPLLHSLAATVAAAP